MAWTMIVKMRLRNATPTMIVRNLNLCDRMGLSSPVID
jgi:hypothetical protein